MQVSKFKPNSKFLDTVDTGWNRRPIDSERNDLLAVARAGPKICLSGSNPILIRSRDPRPSSSNEINVDANLAFEPSKA